MKRNLLLIVIAVFGLTILACRSSNRSSGKSPKKAKVGKLDEKTKKYWHWNAG